MNYTFIALVENKPGVLNRVASLFRRRNFNIESLAVGRTENPEVSRMTIVVDCPNGNMDAHRIEGAFALDESLRDALEAPLPDAKRTYYDVFTDMDVWDQLRVQANAERQGARAWRNIATRTTDQRVLEQLATCSTLEEASADRLDALIATHAP